MSKCTHSQEPNEETAKVLRDTDQCKNLVEHENVDEFWKSLGLDDKPNAETQKAMRDVDERKNLTRCNSIEEFWQAIGIDLTA